MASKHASQKRYPPELKERAVKMALDQIAEQGGQRFGVVTRVARQLGVGPESLRGWLRQAEIDEGSRAGTTSADAARIAELEREVKDLRRANAILKEASVFFATELDGRPKR
jgi:transposase